MQDIPGCSPSKSELHGGPGFKFTSSMFRKVYLRKLSQICRLHPGSVLSADHQILWKATLDREVSRNDEAPGSCPSVPSLPTRQPQTKHPEESLLTVKHGFCLNSVCEKPLIHEEQAGT